MVVLLEGHYKQIVGSNIYVSIGAGLKSTCYLSVPSLSMLCGHRQLLCFLCTDENCRESVLERLRPTAGKYEMLDKASPAQPYCI